ncbi:MAG: hypothetical protein AB6733_07465 [Clostridiaceae bacterium]
MEDLIRISDQTIDEALRLNVDIEKIKSIISTVKKYYVKNIDISLSHLEKNIQFFRDEKVLNQIRCIVNCTFNDIDKAKKLGISKTIISLKDDTTIKDLLALSSILNQVKDFTKEIYLSINDLSVLNSKKITCLKSIIDKHKIKSLIYKDKNGSLDPFKVFSILKNLQKNTPCKVEFFASNVYGLATANTLAAFKAGIRTLGTSVGGVGLNGFAAMEEVLMSLKHLWKQDDIINGSSLAFDCSEILNSMGIDIPIDKAIIGNYVFAHESGIHVDGIAKNPLLYEVIKPEEVGLTRKLIIGKHSGTASLKFKFLQWNLEIKPNEAAELLEEVKEIAIKQKKPLSDYQLKQLYEEKYMKSVFIS